MNDACRTDDLVRGVAFENQANGWSGKPPKSAARFGFGSLFVLTPLTAQNTRTRRQNQPLVGKKDSGR